MKAFAAIVSLCLVPALALSQKIGILPFEDASGVGPEFGEQVAKFIRSEFLQNKKILPKFIQYKPGPDESTSVDVEKAVALGKKNGVDYVVIGTILEAEATSSSNGVGGVSILGQSVGSSLRTVSAAVTIQGDLISVAKGELVQSFRESGSKTDNSVGTDVSTEWGSVNSDQEGGANTPNAQALREAVEKLVADITAKL
ncbi:MAG TPA: CsgG/HfaB family protein [Bacteroidota bacterium]|nr:CsgG/HfaB family protein [Bacteroidota bacterium]